MSTDTPPKLLGQITIRKPVTDYDLECILCGCFEGGSNYWIGDVKVKDFMGKSRASEVPGAGGIIIIYEIVEYGDPTILKEHKLSCARLFKGIKTYYEKHIGACDFEDMDTGDYDCILQYALFGEIVYG